MLLFLSARGLLREVDGYASCFHLLDYSSRRVHRKFRCAVHYGDPRHWKFHQIHIGTAFKTDTDISKTGARRERELQAWQSDPAEANGTSPAAPAPTNPRNVDELTFGPGASGGSWDQFAANEKLFGVKAGFDEDLYTTKLDRNAPDFKEKERRAQQLANEIMSVSSLSIVSDDD